MTRVLAAVSKIEHGDSILGVQISTLGYHGVTQPEMEKSLRDALWDEVNRYTQRDAVKTETLQIPGLAMPEGTA